MQNTSACDEDRILELRVQGKSFAGIAKTLGLDRPCQANDAFNRALRRQQPARCAALRGQELTRLDALADGIRAHRELGAHGLPAGCGPWHGCEPMLMAE